MRSLTYYWNLINVNSLNIDHNFSCGWLISCIVVSWGCGLALFVIGLCELQFQVMLVGLASLVIGSIIGITPGAICTYFMVRRGAAFYHIAECMDGIRRGRRGE
jgi:hypothetical protein